MITLYTHSTPNGYKISIALEEMGLDYEPKVVEVFQGAGQAPEFLARSPAGKIPVIEDHETGVCLYESNAILEYLARKTGQLGPRGERERWEASALLYLQASLQGPMFGQRAHFSMFAPETVPYGIARYEQQGETLDELCRRLLQGKQYFLRSGYSIVDVAFFAWYHSALHTGFFEPEDDALGLWYRSIEARPAVQAGIKATPAIHLPPRRQLAEVS